MQIKPQLDFNKVLADKENIVNLLLSLQGPKLPDENRRNPLRLVALLDHSPSMNSSVDAPHGTWSPIYTGNESKLDRLKATMLKLVDNLTPQDQLAIVWFAEDASTKGFSAMTSANRDKLKREIKAIGTRSATNIGRALEVANEVLRTVKDEPGTMTRVLMLTDGEATSGDRTPDGLVARVGALPSFAGLSCFGYGLDWNEDLLSAMSSKGGGGYYFIDNIKVVTRAFASEIGGLLTCYAKNIEVKLTMPHGVVFDKLLNEYPFEIMKNEITIEAGDLFFEEDRKLVMRFKVPKDKQIGFATGNQIDLADIVVTMDSLVDGKSVTQQGGKVTLEVVTKEEDLPAKANKAVAEEVAVLEAALAQVKAKEMAKQGDLVGARSVLADQVRVLQSFDSGGYACAFAGLVQENLDGLKDGYDTLSAKSFSSSSAYALRAKRGGLGSMRSAAIMYNATTPDSVKAQVDKFEAKDDDVGGHA